jgi:hypothetical protein
MNRPAKMCVLVAGLAVGSCLLSACVTTPVTETRLRVQDDFGQAVSQDLASQIADPDAGLNAGPPPPSSGARAEGAQARYQADQVIQPSGIGASGNAGYGANGAGATPSGSAGVGSGSAVSGATVSGP